MAINIFPPSKLLIGFYSLTLETLSFLYRIHGDKWWMIFFDHFSCYNASETKSLFLVQFDFAVLACYGRLHVF